MARLATFAKQSKGLGAWSRSWDGWGGLEEGGVGGVLLCRALVCDWKRSSVLPDDNRKKVCEVSMAVCTGASQLGLLCVIMGHWPHLQYVHFNVSLTHTDVSLRHIDHTCHSRPHQLLHPFNLFISPIYAVRQDPGPQVPQRLCYKYHLPELKPMLHTWLNRPSGRLTPEKSSEIVIIS